VLRAKGRKLRINVIIEMRDYKKYDVWNVAHQLAPFVDKEIIPGFPKTEHFALANQIRCAAYSVQLNIAEGCGRNSDKDFVHFLDIFLGSLHELEYCLLLTYDLSYITQNRLSYRPKKQKK
jgi:four helix bundle protein